MTEGTKFATTMELANLLQIHQFSVSRIFGEAYSHRRMGVQNSGPKCYSLPKVAQTVSEASGFTIGPHQLADLIDRQEALSLLEELGKPRSYSTWTYWRRKEIGPRCVMIGWSERYFRSEVIKWADQLSATTHGFVRGQRPDVKRSQQDGPNAPSQICQGDEGGSVHFSLSEAV